jgi:hypothetical protein
MIAPPPQAARADPRNGPDPKIPKAKGSFSLVKKPASIASAIGPKAASPTPTPIRKIIRSQNCCAKPERPVRILHINIVQNNIVLLLPLSANIPNTSEAIPKKIAKTVPNKKPICVSLNRRSALSSGIIIEGSCLSAKDKVLTVVIKKTAIQANFDDAFEEMLI